MLTAFKWEWLPLGQWWKKKSNKTVYQIIVLTTVMFQINLSIASLNVHENACQQRLKEDNPDYCSLIKKKKKEKNNYTVVDRKPMAT